MFNDEYPELPEASPLFGKGGGNRKHRGSTIDIIPVMTGQKKWYQSSSIMGAAVTLLIMIVGLFGWATNMPVEAIIAAGTAAVSNLWSIIGSFKRKTTIEKSLL